MIILVYACLCVCDRLRAFNGWKGKKHKDFGVKMDHYKHNYGSFNGLNLLCFTILDS